MTSYYTAHVTGAYSAETDVSAAFSFGVNDVIPVVVQSVAKFDSASYVGGSTKRKSWRINVFFLFSFFSASGFGSLWQYLMFLGS